MMIVGSPLPSTPTLSAAVTAKVTTAEKTAIAAAAKAAGMSVSAWSRRALLAAAVQR